MLAGDGAEEVRKLKTNAGGDLLIMGGGALIRSLMPHRLIELGCPCQERDDHARRHHRDLPGVRVEARPRAWLPQA